MIKYNGFSTLEILSVAVNYNKWIAEEIAKYLTPPVLEIGAGTGNLSDYCLNSKPFYLTDKDSGLVRLLRKKYASKEGIMVNQFDIVKDAPKQLMNIFNSVFAVNVLEHIEDDQKVLNNIRPLLRKNGRLTLLVPAKKFAYTKLDKELGHVRRYEKEELTKKLISAGYKIERIKFFNITGLLSWYIRDKVNKKNIKLRPYQVTIFDKIVPILKLVESKINIPMGISLIASARKQ